MEGSSVTFKGTVNGLNIIMKEEADFETILLQMEQKIETAGRFFKGASLAVKYRGRKLTEQEEHVIYNLLVQKSGAEIKSFEEDSEDYSDNRSDASPKNQDRMRMHKFYFKGIEEGITKFYKGTVRSGQLINFNGNLVVIGDVNPGGELIATGNVIVIGSLRGIVHAGSDGNKEAMVVALSLQPTQLRIADIITRSPDEKESRAAPIPELAYVKGDMVYIERFLSQR